MASIIDLSPVFVDFEASGLDGFPIEVGWAFVDGSRVVHEGHLILPAPEWDLESRWDENAEALHGISRAELQAWGEQPLLVAKRMNAALAGRELFADSPFDKVWLEQLFEDIGVQPAFTMQIILAQTLVDRLCLALGLYETEIAKITQQVHRDFPHTHRAMSDARQWAELWKALQLSAAPG